MLITVHQADVGRSDGLHMDNWDFDAFPVRADPLDLAVRDSPGSMPGGLRHSDGAESGV